MRVVELKLLLGLKTTSLVLVEVFPHPQLSRILAPDARRKP